MIYKGLTGSRLFGSELENSDYDIFAVGDCNEFGKIEIGLEFHWLTAKRFLQDIFEKPMPCSHRLFAELYSKPLIESPAATFLVENREALLQSNLKRFGGIIYKYATIMSGPPELFDRFPKRTVYAIRGFNEYIRYATEDIPFSEAMLQQGDLLELVKSIKAKTVSYEEILPVLNELAKKAEVCRDFWDKEPDMETFERLKKEMTEAFT